MGSSVRFGFSPSHLAFSAVRKEPSQPEETDSHSASSSASPASQPITPPERSMSPLALLYYFCKPFVSPALAPEKESGREGEVLPLLELTSQETAGHALIPEKEALTPPQLTPEETEKLGKEFLRLVKKQKPLNDMPETKQADSQAFAELKAILKRGLSVDYPERYQKTAVMYAAESGHLPLVKFLVEEQGANIHLTDRDGFNALHLATSGAYNVKEGEEDPHNQVAQFLLEKRIDFRPQAGHLKDTPLGITARRGNIPLLKMLLAKYEEEGGETGKLAALNQGNRNGDTPLHSAAGAHQLEVARILLAAGADVNAANPKDGNRPAHRAAIIGDKEMLLLLYRNKAKMYLRNKAGEVPQDLVRDPSLAQLGFMYPKLPDEPPRNNLSD